VACNFIIWDSKIEIPQEQVDLLIKECKENQTNPEKFYSTYLDGKADITFKKESRKLYKTTIDDILQDFGIWDSCMFYVDYWVQMYSDTNENFHDVHVHYAGAEFISWVHFIHTPEQNCFYFFDGHGKKHYPEKQRSGDFIVFPSWMPHGIEPVIEEGFDRVVVAGNVSMSMLEFGNIKWNSNSWNKSTLFIRK